MDIEQKFEIAYRMLDQGLSFEDISLCSEEQLAIIATETLLLKPEELSLFAEEVAQRSRRRAHRDELEKIRRETVTLIVTDDTVGVEAILTYWEKWASESLDNLELSEMNRSPFRKVFLIRDQQTASTLGQILGEEIAVSSKQLPTLKPWDFILRLHPCIDEPNELGGTLIHLAP